MFSAAAGVEGGQAIRDLLRAGETEILDALAVAEEEPELIVTRIRVKGSAARIAELRRELADWIERLEELDDDGDDDVDEAGALIAFYPVRERERTEEENE